MRRAESIKETDVHILVTISEGKALLRRHKLLCEDKIKMFFDSLQQQLAKIIFNNLFRTTKETQHFTITKINLLKLFKKTIVVCIENHTKHIKKCTVC
jgi:hypothetical protein